MHVRARLHKICRFILKTKGDTEEHGALPYSLGIPMIESKDLRRPEGPGNDWDLRRGSNMQGGQEPDLLSSDMLWLGTRKQSR